MRLFIDGVSPEEFSFSYYPDPWQDRIDLHASNNYWHSIGATRAYGRNEFGLFDEYAFYDFVLNPTLVAKHHDRALNHGEHYSYTDDLIYCGSGADSDPDQGDGSIFAKYFPPGYAGSGISGAGIDFPMKQYEESPFPRYLPENELIRNIPWVGMQYLGGSNANNYLNGNQNLPLMYAEAGKLNAELALHWNYFAQIERDNTDWAPLKDFANAHPDLPICDIINWGQIPAPQVNREDLGSAYYLKDPTGQNFNYLDNNGNPHVLWDPASPAGQVEMDGINKASLVDQHMEGLQRPLNLLNENGEVHPLATRWSWDEHYNGFNADLKNEFDAYGGTWKHFQGKKKTDLRVAYRNAIYANYPALNDHKTKFSYYSVDAAGGHYVYDSWAWNEVKQVQRNFDGSNFYSTPDIYPARPEKWFETFGGMNHGMDYLGITRQAEVDQGDVLSSPYVCAGWGTDPTNNLAPGPWLGLLKAMGVAGAEFYYTGFFSNVPDYHTSVNGTHTNQDARTWAWQLLMPSYAQAVTSRYEDLLRNGTLMNDPDLIDGSTGIPFINILGGGTNVYTTARKGSNSTNGLTEYAISTSIQPLSNSQPPTSKTMLLEDFDGGVMGDITLESRTQGSTYLLRKHDNANQGSTYNQWVLIQLDKWHEPYHPQWWSSDYAFEAEVADEVWMGNRGHVDPKAMTVLTRIVDPNTGQETIPSQTDMDFSHFVSYYSFGNTTIPGGGGSGGSGQSGCSFTSEFGPAEQHPRLSYKFRVQADGDSYRLFIRARLKPGTTGETAANIQLVDEGREEQILSDYIRCITSNDWEWYTIGLCGNVDLDNLDKGYYFLDVYPNDAGFEIDQLVLDKDKDSTVLLGQSMACSNNSYPHLGTTSLPENEACTTSTFTHAVACSGKAIQFSTFITPKLPSSCGPVAKYGWQVLDASSTLIESVALAVGNTVLPPSGVPNSLFGGTHERPLITYPSAGTYTVIMEVEIGGLVQSISKTVTVYDNPSVSVLLNGGTGPITVCEGQSVQLSSTVTGGTAGYTYSWFPSLTTEFPNKANTTAYPNEYNGVANGSSPFKQNQYKLTVTDTNGCVGEDEAPVITVNKPLQVTITSPTHANLEVCHGLTGGSTAPNKVEITADVCTTSCTTNYSTPVGALSYQWDVGNNQIASGFNSQTAQLANPNGLETKVYQVTVTDVNGCKGDTHAVVTVNPSTISVDVGNATSSARISRCLGTTGVINSATEIGSAISSSGGSGTLTLSWSAESLGANGTTPFSTNAGNDEADFGNVSTALEPTLYTITATDANGCTGEGHIWLDVIEIDPQIESFERVCETNTAVSVDLVATPDHAGYLYTWSSPNTSPTPTFTCTTNCVQTAVSLAVPTTFGDSTTYDIDLQVTEPILSCSETVTKTIKVVHDNCASRGSEEVEPNSDPEGDEVIEKELENGSSILLYPNPNNGVFQIQFTGELENEILQVVVMDLQGKVITHRIKEDQSRLQFELDELPKGVYLIRVFNENHNLRVGTVID
ncbi:T9SS type A sorting domain-containing protein [bacterium SCSIO 12741]|nr:T9SS type A sorting domain-containing protein [bacterium SCSIO 12741]